MALALGPAPPPPPAPPSASASSAAGRRHPAAGRGRRRGDAAGTRGCGAVALWRGWRRLLGGRGGGGGGARSHVREAPQVGRPRSGEPSGPGLRVRGDRGAGWACAAEALPVTPAGPRPSPASQCAPGDPRDLGRGSPRGHAVSPRHPTLKTRTLICMQKCGVPSRVRRPKSAPALRVRRTPPPGDHGDPLAGIASRTPGVFSLLLIPKAQPWPFLRAWPAPACLCPPGAGDLYLCASGDPLVSGTSASRPHLTPPQAWNLSPSPGWRPAPVPVLSRLLPSSFSQGPHSERI
ncbi:laforin-like [Peromyscus californicus insignis]|uniref:laforin-like n=1 Tax=Peromyscus californicus insignis TaxID=564181 RepID=UPI0022A66670|nr:laforin-like [Peromyscus californicus insignis]